MIAIVVGIIVGILTAIRQYSGFDYVVTFLAFLFYSLPVFWVAVLLKEYAGIEFNNWMREPTLTPVQIILIAVILGFILQAVLGGHWKRRLLTAGIALVVIAGALAYFSSVEWFRRPMLGIGFVALVGIAAAVGSTALFSGINNRKVLYATLTTAGVGILAYLPVRPLIDEPTWLLLIGLFVLTIVVSYAIGWFMGLFAQGGSQPFPLHRCVDRIPHIH